jgi:Flp pilus assembly protein TadG
MGQMRRQDDRNGVARPRRGLWRDRSGAALVEFAFVAVPLAALIVAVLEVCTTFFAQQLVESATEVVGRRLMTGEAQKANTTATQFRTIACNELPSFMDCSRLMIDVRSVNSFSGASAAGPTMTYDANGNVTNTWQYSPGGPGSINIVRVMYRWKTGTGPLGFGLANMPGGQRLLYATSVYKAESY